MNRLHRVFWLLTLCAFVSGCSGYRLAALPGDDPAAAPADEVDTVAVGSVVRVTTTAGEAHQGKVVRLTHETLVLDLGEVGAGGAVVLACEDIASVELSGAKPGTKVLMVTVVLGIALLYLALADMHRLNN